MLLKYLFSGLLCFARKDELGFASTAGRRCYIGRFCFNGETGLLVLWTHGVRPYEGWTNGVRPYEGWTNGVRPYEGWTHGVRPYEGWTNEVRPHEGGKAIRGVFYDKAGDSALYSGDTGDLSE